jgi:hypothetical protein
MKNTTLSSAYASAMPRRIARPSAGAPTRLVRAETTRLVRVEKRPVTAPPARLPESDALLIAVRRSLASCRDTSQLRTLLALEAKTFTM